MADLFDDLFGGGLDTKLDFLNDDSKQNNDGMYRVDLSKVKDKKRGWKSVVRFLPNLTKEKTIGQSAIEKVSHYVDIKEPKELSGWFDSPKSFGKKEKCTLSDTYYQMKNSKNAILIEKADQLKYSRKYFSYVLVVEDEQQPELVGKIMVFSYGKTIREKILAEKNGEVSGVPCNIFDLERGKDFVLLVKEIQTGDDKYPDYKNSSFRESTPISLYSKEKGEFRLAPVDGDGNIIPQVKSKIAEYLLDREKDLEDFAPRRLTEEEESKITEIVNFLTGKSTQNYRKQNQPDRSDFIEDSEDDSFSTSNTTNQTVEEDDDFFSDF
jgi:hypothetical protein